MKSKKIIIWLVVLLILGSGAYWLYREVTKPLPGEFMGDQGREHLTNISEIVYNSNPPTSGSHFPIWAKPGIYDRLISDGYFLHSMEHGYIILWYNCGGEITPSPIASASVAPLKIMTAQPTSTTSWITTQSMPEEEIPLPESFKSDSCVNLVKELSEFTKVAERIIVAPRINMDTPIAITAWRRIEKLQNIDKEKITSFINTYHNHGPEQTME